MKLQFSRGKKPAVSILICFVLLAVARPEPCPLMGQIVWRFDLTNPALQRKIHSQRAIWQASGGRSSLVIENLPWRRFGALVEPGFEHLTKSGGWSQMVETGTAIRQRHGKNSAGPQNPLDALKESDWVREMLEIVGGQNEIEAAGTNARRFGQIGNLMRVTHKINRLDPSGRARRNTRSCLGYFAQFVSVENV